MSRAAARAAACPPEFPPISFGVPQPALDALVDLIADAVAERLGPVSSPCLLLARSDLARALGCSVATVDRLVRDGAPSVRLIDSRRFVLVDVLEWLRSRERAT